MASVVNIEQDGTFILWGAKLITDIPISDFGDTDLMSQIVDTMSLVEMADLRVDQILAFYDELGAVVVVEPEIEHIPFYVSFGTEQINCVESSRCKECESIIQWNFSFDGHLEDCPFLLVQSIMTE